MAESISLLQWVGSNRAIIALVLTDIISSTCIGRGLGDSAWNKVLQKHFERARFYKTLHEGFEVKLIGDASMIAFHTADKALHFALEFSKDTGDPLIAIKQGIHVGPVEIIENDMYGLMINYLSRMLSAMKKPQIIMSPAAVSNIRYQLGTRVKDLGRIRESRHGWLKDFPKEEQLLLELVPPKTENGRRGTPRYDPRKAVAAAGIGISQNAGPRGVDD